MFLHTIWGGGVRKSNGKNHGFVLTSSTPSRQMVRAERGNLSRLNHSGTIPPPPLTLALMASTIPEFPPPSSLDPNIGTYRGSPLI